MQEKDWRVGFDFCGPELKKKVLKLTEYEYEKIQMGLFSCVQALSPND